MEVKERIITGKKSTAEYLKEIWLYRELFWILAKRDILVKYKQTVLGVGWSAIRPLVWPSLLVRLENLTLILLYLSHWL
jgi:lipopolysaccharide transport system permease protein